MTGLPLRFGYTLDQLHRLTLTACQAATGAHHNATDRYAAAQDAIVDVLLAATDRPGPGRLVLAGRRGIGEFARTERHHHGITYATPWAKPGSMGAFARYWADVRANVGDPAPGVVERVALAQILPHLTPGQRRALDALALLGDYQAAADALGLGYNAFVIRIRDARRRFKALWHQGETPSPGYGWDRRRGGPTARRRDQHRGEAA